MGFLGGLFKKKPGGTFFGNLLRAGVSSVSGGMLGSGNNRIELGNTKTNAQIAAEQSAAPAPGTNPNGFANTNQGGVYAEGGSQENKIKLDEITVRLDKITAAEKNNPLELLNRIQPVQQDNSNMLMLAGLGLLAVVMMNKK